MHLYLFQHIKRFYYLNLKRFYFQKNQFSWDGQIIDDGILDQEWLIWEILAT